MVGHAAGGRRHRRVEAAVSRGRGIGDIVRRGLGARTIGLHARQGGVHRNGKTHGGCPVGSARSLAGAGYDRVKAMAGI